VAYTAYKLQSRPK